MVHIAKTCIKNKEFNMLIKWIRRFYLIWKISSTKMPPYIYNLVFFIRNSLGHWNPINTFFCRTANSQNKRFYFLLLLSEIKWILALEILVLKVYFIMLFGNVPGLLPVKSTVLMILQDQFASNALSRVHWLAKI